MIKPISKEEALTLLQTEGEKIYDLLLKAGNVRRKTRGSTVNLCGIVNAKSGKCGEDCKFCAQSVHNDVDIDCYDLMSEKEMVTASTAAGRNKASRFGIVTSGLAVEEGAELDRICNTIETINKRGEIMPCASLGNVSSSVLKKLKKAGLTRYHCNLESSSSFYKKICTTRPWIDAVNTVKRAKDLGLAVCSGGLFGLGESPEQRVELLDEIKKLDVDSVPINFYNPPKGARIFLKQPITPFECLKIIAVARLMLPYKEIRVCGGREYNLRDFQSWMFLSGADGLMVGGYLTTQGRNIKDDLTMIKDAGLKINFN
jgi:biotin synthase